MHAKEGIITCSQTTSVQARLTAMKSWHALLLCCQFVVISIYLLVFFVFSLLGVRLERMLFIIANNISAYMSIFAIYQLSKQLLFVEHLVLFFYSSCCPTWKHTFRYCQWGFLIPVYVCLTAPIGEPKSLMDDRFVWLLLLASPRVSQISLCC